MQKNVIALIVLGIVVIGEASLRRASLLALPLSHSTLSSVVFCMRGGDDVGLKETQSDNVEQDTRGVVDKDSSVAFDDGTTEKVSSPLPHHETTTMKSTMDAENIGEQRTRHEGHEEDSSSASERLGMTDTEAEPNAEKKPFFWRSGGASSAMQSLRVQLDELKRRHSSFNEKFKFNIPSSSVDHVKKNPYGLIVATAVMLARQFGRGSDAPITILSVFVLSLAGSASGFYRFLYFVTVGYGCAVGLPSAALLVAYNSLSSRPIPVLSNIHTAFALLWSVRLVSFLLYREYVDWPQLHKKVVEVDRTSEVRSKLAVWYPLAAFYFAMIAPCYFRLQAAASGAPCTEWGPFGVTGIVLQAVGILVEGVADFQKSAFKSRPGNRNRWCNEGLWRFSTHPNYLGEVVFWIGTYIGGATCCYRNFTRFILSTAGLMFIVVVVRGAVAALGAKQIRKYGMDEEFLEFRRTHGILGPLWFTQPDIQLSL